MAGNESEFLERIREEKWSIYNRTSNRNKIKSRDRVLFYLAGPHRKKIIASSVLSSELKKEDENFTIDLAQIDVWKKHVSVQHLIGSLDFIKNKAKWGVHMQGGIVHLSDKDYDMIVDAKSK